MAHIARRTVRGASLALVMGVVSLALADAPKDRFERADVQRMHMHESFDLVRAIERLLLSGKLDEAKRFATTISQAPDSPAHGAWATHVVAVRDSAAALARVTTVEQGCRAVATLASACAGCHVDTGVAPQFGTFPLPPDKTSVDARMMRHRWAADRLWEGIIGGEDAPWTAGLDVLAAAPLDWAALPERAAFAKTLQQLATTARKQKRATIATRTKAYGEILVTCAGCHAAKPTKGATTK